MADVNESELHSSQEVASESIPLRAQNVIDLTEDDDFRASVSVAYFDNFAATSSPRNFQETELVAGTESLDESLSIVYENIQPARKVEILEPNASGEFVMDLLKSSPKPRAHIRKVVIEPRHVQVSLTLKTKVPSSKPGGRSITQSVTRVYSEVNEPTTTFKTEKTKNTKVTCGICLDTADEIVETNRKLLSTICGHIFCCECYKKSKATSRCCPTCRKRLNKNQVHPLYL